MKNAFKQYLFGVIALLLSGMSIGSSEDLFKTDGTQGRITESSKGWVVENATPYTISGTFAVIAYDDFGSNNIAQWEPLSLASKEISTAQALPSFNGVLPFAKHPIWRAKLKYNGIEYAINTERDKCGMDPTKEATNQPIKMVIYGDNSRLIGLAIEVFYKGYEGNYYVLRCEEKTILNVVNGD